MEINYHIGQEFRMWTEDHFVFTENCGSTIKTCSSFTLLADVTAIMNDVLTDELVLTASSTSSKGGLVH